jgi:hypothetical protein
MMILLNQMLHFTRHYRVDPGPDFRASPSGSFDGPVRAEFANHLEESLHSYMSIDAVSGWKRQRGVGNRSFPLEGVRYNFLKRRFGVRVMAACMNGVEHFPIESLQSNGIYTSCR